MKATDRPLRKTRGAGSKRYRGSYAGSLRVVVLAGLGLMLAGNSVSAQNSWRRHYPRQNNNRNVPRPPRPAHPPVVVDTAALELLKKVFHHTLDFAGVQRTQSGAKTSEQKVMGDTHGHLRMEYTVSHEFQGDILLSGPSDFAYYHARKNRTDVAYWPVSREVKEQEIINLVKRGAVALAITGQETIIGRPCGILTLSWQGPGAQAETQRRLWVDTESGITMRNERWNARGQISASYMTSIVIGPEAGVLPRDFQAGLLPKNAKSEPKFPEDQPTFATAAQAEAQAGFHILEPGQLPENYTLDGVWVFGRGKGTSVLLRYTMGVNHFSLFERVAYNLPPEQLNRPYRRAAANIQRWVAPIPGGIPLHMLYIGHLSADEVQAIHDSMK